MNGDNFENVEIAKRRFLSNEFMMLAWAAAVQQRGAGKMLWKKESKKETQLKVRKDICIYVEKLMGFYSHKVLKEEHIEKINDLMKYINEDIPEIHSVADKEKSLIFTFATAQKLLNTALKYWWCAGWIPEPPHFPLDSINLSKLPENEPLSKKKWTSDKKGEIYNSVIPKFEELIKKENYFSLASWELCTWRRRTEIVEIDDLSDKKFTQST